MKSEQEIEEKIEHAGPQAIIIALCVLISFIITLFAIL